MALPPPLRDTVTPQELEMIACQQLVEIIPLIAMEKTAFISGAYGPLRPPNKAKIPLWMAVNLKMKKKCHIVPPKWLNVEFLSERLEREIAQPDAFCEMPFRFAEVAKVLIDLASDDLENPDQIRSLLKDLREARQAKSRAGLSQIDHSDLSLTNFCSMEINEIRPVFVQSMSLLTKLKTPENA
ncbi:DNA replication complex GINS protein PSF2 [Coprinopsis cinerea AmutBmut pab1-1]|nr:DNA replication complex GINS protein PSF2 [Coprinopsis cinerea AmutBmut pab1-1]